MNETISVIIPVYKVEQYLDTCVQSVVNQTYTNLEIILVDDGSPDNCGAMCDAWAEKDSRIKVVHQKNGGLAAARNAGLRVATCQWITFIDSDDVVSVHLIEGLLREPLEKDHIAVSSIAKFTGTPPEDREAYACKYIEGNNWLAGRTSYFATGVLYNREIINSAKLMFDTNLEILEDEGWNAVYLLFVRRIVYITEPMYYYRQNPASLTGGGTNHKRWAHAWQKVQISVMKWYAANDAERQYDKECRAFYRHCQNKMIDDCVKGALSYAEHKVPGLEISGSVDRLLTRLFPAEYGFSKCMPRLYFACYLGLMKLRNKLVAIRRGA